MTRKKADQCQYPDRHGAPGDTCTNDAARKRNTSHGWLWLCSEHANAPVSELFDERLAANRPVKAARRKGKTDDILPRLAIYRELGVLSSVAIHPETPGYSTGRLWGTARDATKEIRRLRAQVRETKKGRAAALDEIAAAVSDCRRQGDQDAEDYAKRILSQLHRAGFRIVLADNQPTRSSKR